MKNTKTLTKRQLMNRFKKYVVAVSLDNPTYEKHVKLFEKEIEEKEVINKAWLCNYTSQVVLNIALATDMTKEQRYSITLKLDNLMENKTMYLRHIDFK